MRGFENIQRELGSCELRNWREGKKRPQEREKHYLCIINKQQEMHKGPRCNNYNKHWHAPPDTRRPCFYIERGLSCPYGIRCRYSHYQGSHSNPQRSLDQSSLMATSISLEPSSLQRLTEEPACEMNDEDTEVKFKSDSDEQEIPLAPLFPFKWRSVKQEKHEIIPTDCLAEGKL